MDRLRYEGYTRHRDQWKLCPLGVKKPSMSGNRCDPREVHCGTGHVGRGQEKGEWWDTRTAREVMSLFIGLFHRTMGNHSLWRHTIMLFIKEPQRPKHLQDLKEWDSDGGVPTPGRDILNNGVFLSIPQNILLTGKKRKSQLNKKKHNYF